MSNFWLRSPRWLLLGIQHDGGVLEHPLPQVLRGFYLAPRQLG